MPCVQTRGQNEKDIRNQIDRFRNNGRKYCLRLFINRLPTNINQIINAFNALGTADFAIILEGGWTDDPLSLAPVFEGLISNYLSELNADLPIVLSCTSIPKTFQTYDNGINHVEFTNRQLVQQIQRSQNKRTIVYGDWGSTRPRDPGGFGMHPMDRIDYPTAGGWCIARNKTAEWDFQKAARAIISSTHWSGNLGVWGEEMIEQTAINADLGIDTPQKNVAARVNIHLHRQAFYGVANIGGMNLDEDWVD